MTHGGRVSGAGAEEIRRLFDAEQKHVAEMRAWLQQKESLERENDDATKQIDDLERELDSQTKELDKTKLEKHSVEKILAVTKRQEEDLQERLTAAQQELGIRRVAEQTHKVRNLFSTFHTAAEDFFRRYLYNLLHPRRGTTSYTRIQSF